MIRLVLSILLLCSASAVSFSQNLDSLRYSFLNQKVAKDSLGNFPLSNRIMSIDTICSVKKYISTNYQDTTIRCICNDLGSLFSADGLGKYLDSTEVVESFNRVYENGRLESVSLILNPLFRKQVRTKKGEKWDRQKLHQQSLFSDQMKRKERKKRGVYVMSNPVFFGNMDRAIIFVTKYSGPFSIEGYVEYYEKDEKGEWTVIHRYLSWIS